MATRGKKISEAPEAVTLTGTERVGIAVDNGNGTFTSKSTTLQEVVDQLTRPSPPPPPTTGFSQAGGSALADANGSVFVVPAAGRFALVKPAGITADGTTNDRAGVQDRLDKINAGLLPPDTAAPPQRLDLPDGTLKLGDTIHLGYGGSFPFTTVWLAGSGNDYVGEGGIFRGTVLRSDTLDRPAVAVQGARLSKIENLAIRGVNRDTIWSHLTDYFGNAAIFDASDKTRWRGATLTASPDAYSRYAPYCGVAIDPYSGTRPGVSYADVAYPAGQSSVQWGRSVSSQVCLLDATVTGFEVGIVSAPSGSDGNGDFVCLDRCNVVANVYAISVCQSQGRLNHFHYCNFADNHTVLTTRTHGAQNGGTNFRFVGCVFGSNVQLLDIDTAIAGSIVFSSCYMEQVWMIGFIGANTANGVTVRFLDCDMHLFDNGPYLGVPAKVAEGNGANSTLALVGGNLSIDTVAFFACPLEIDRTLIIGQWITGLGSGTSLAQRKMWNLCQGVMVQPTSMQKWRDKIVPTSSLYFVDVDGNTGGTLDNGRFQTGGRKKPIPWFVTRVSNGEGAAVPSHPSPVPFWSVYDKNSVNWSGFNTTTGTGQLVIPETTIEAQIGDMLYDDQTQTVWYVTAAASSVTGLNLNNSTITVVPLTNTKSSPVVMRDALSTTVGYLYLIRSGVYGTQYPIFGDFTASSATIDNVQRGDGYSGFLTADVAVGDFLLYGLTAGNLSYVQPRCKVTARSNTGGSVEGGTITMDRPALRSGTKVPLGFFLRGDS